MEANVGYQKLNEHYPGCITPGVILGDAQAIVGQFGLELCFANYNGEINRIRYKENDKINIVKFTEESLFINDGFVEHVSIPYQKIKGFSFKNRVFTNPNFNHARNR